MIELGDHELLAQYAHEQSDAAFAILVSRHVNLVHSAALRFTGSRDNAEEITQAVFIILARKAGGLKRSTVLSGWLYQTARLAAANFVKGEIRRQRREQEVYMQSTLNDTEVAAWERIAPVLDEAMGKLGKTDRNAVVLRFFENKTAHEIAAALNVREETAQKRVVRALGKLRRIFHKRGLTLTGTLIAGALVANSVRAAPVGLAATATAAAAKGAFISATIATLVEGTLRAMAWVKLKLALGVGLAAAAAGGVAVVAIPQSYEAVNPDYSNFANYLTNHGWLKEFNAVLNNSRYKPENIMDPESKLYKGNSTWEASIQPGGFFVKIDGHMSPITIGESSTEYWAVGPRGPGIAMKDPAEGGSEKNGRNIISQTYKRMLVTILNLGIEGLDNSNIVWLSKDKFMSPSLDYRGHPTNGSVQVTIESGDKNGLPLRLRCISTVGKEKKESVIKCSYDEPTLPPSKVVVETSLNGVKQPDKTNIIRDAIFGLREGGAKGFSPSEFFARIPNRMIVESNGVRYVTDQSGTRAIDEVTASAALEQNRAEAKRIKDRKH
jgi:RNA polymerase sigma factor (sigma-70 family)